MRTEVREILERIAAGAVPGVLESEVLEFKEQQRSLDDTEKDVADAVLCFANALGGTVIVGISDKSGGAAAFKGTSLDTQRLKQRIWNHSRPSVLVDVEEVQHGGTRLVVVRVPESVEVHSDPKGRTPRRVGTDCQPLTSAQQTRLREERIGNDPSALGGGRGLRDVDAAAVEEARRLLRSLTDNRRKLASLDDADLLRALGLMNRDGELLRAGEILVGRANAHEGPVIVYQYRRSSGGEPRFVLRLERPLLSALARLFQAIDERQETTPLTLRDGAQVQLHDFPGDAIREAISNAVVHRDLHVGDPVQIEHSPSIFIVTSPGPLVSGVTPSNILTHPSRPRSPLLARAARTLGLAEEVGRGVDRMYQAMVRSGRELPQITSTSESVRVALAGGTPNTGIARFVAQLPEDEREDIDALLVLHRLCVERNTNAEEMAPLLQRSVEETEMVLQRLASGEDPLITATSDTIRYRRPRYRLSTRSLKGLRSALRYKTGDTEEVDRRVIAHVLEYGTITNRTLQNILDVDINRARDLLRDLVRKEILEKVSAHARGPGVTYGPGAKFPGRAKPKKRTSKALKRK